jgi:hypothetical protein
MLEPIGRLGIVKEAEPERPRVTVAIVVPFSENVTMPLTGDPLDETEAVKVTGSPEKTVVGEYTNTVVVGAGIVKTAVATAL